MRAQDDQPYYTMRFVRGETLRDIIRRYQARRKAGSVGSLELPRLLTAFVAICNAVGYAHSRGVVHRDIKPANVALGEFGEVVVLDWGLAKLIGETEGAMPGRVELDAGGDDTSYGQVLGTLAYMAPEQARGDVDQIDARTDIYALGAVLFEILTDRIPHQGKTTRELLRTITRGEVLRASEIDAKVPKALSAICVKAMATLPADRYATALDLATDVQRYLADEPVSVYREPWPVRAGRWVRLHRSLCVATAAVLLVATLSASAWTLVEQRRIQRLRTEAHELLSAGQQALAHSDLAEARLQLARAVTVVGQESSLAEIRTDAQSLLDEANRQLAEQQVRVDARQKYARFQELRDTALFHGTLMTGIDVAANLRAAQAAATEALAIFPAPGGKQMPATGSHYYSPTEEREISAGCFELLLLLAEATVHPLPGQPADPKQAEAALAILDRAETWARATRAYHLLRARCLGFAGRAEVAAQERNQAEAILPATALDNFLVADEEYHESRIDDAIKHFGQALRLQPDYFWAHYFLAICNAERGQPAQAIAHSSAALSRRPDFGWIYLIRGIAYGELKDFATAEADFEKARQLGVADYGFYVNRSAIRIQQGKLTQALVDLKQAISLRPEQYQAYVNLAELYRRKRDYGQALKYVEQAIARAPTIAQPYRIKADVMFESRGFPQALEAINEALAVDPATGKVRSADLIKRGQILQQLKQNAEALDCFDQALQLTGDNPQLQRLRTTILLALGRGPEAVEALNHVLKPRQASPDDFRKRGLERALLGDKAGALADYSEALEQDPKSAFLFSRRGWGFLNNATTLALADFEQAIKLAPEQSELYNGRGYARVLLGKYRQGVEDAEEALRREAVNAPLPERLALRSNAACLYAQAAGKASADLDSIDHDELAGKYAAQPSNCSRLPQRFGPRKHAGTICTGHNRSGLRSNSSSACFSRTRRRQYIEACGRWFLNGYEDQGATTGWRKAQLRTVS